MEELYNAANELANTLADAANAFLDLAEARGHRSDLEDVAMALWWVAGDLGHHVSVLGERLYGPY